MVLCVNTTQNISCDFDKTQDALAIAGIEELKDRHCKSTYYDIICAY